MPELNGNFGRLNKNYLFTEIARRVSIYRKRHPDAEIISLGIGDVTKPLTPCVVDALHTAVTELGDPALFRGYPPESGYPFLKTAIAEEYLRFGVKLREDEIFADDGAKSSLGGLVDIFGANTVVITDPVYPAYLDGNIIAGKEIILLPATEENNFLPMPDGVATLAFGNFALIPQGPACGGQGKWSCCKTPIQAERVSDGEAGQKRGRRLLTEKSNNSFVIYLCSPNNPTGSVYNRKQLTEWVRFANSTGSVIIFDAAYSAWLTCSLPLEVSHDTPKARPTVGKEQGVVENTSKRSQRSLKNSRQCQYPRSIFEIPGAGRCAVEVNSLSKSAGFTNLRCSWVVIKNKKMNELWRRRQSAKFNGVSYIVQRAAQAALSAEGREQCAEQIAYYMENAKLLTEFLREMNAKFYGGVNSPYIWLRCPAGAGSWEFFDRLLTQCQIAVTPGAGFGRQGENFVRLSCFAKREDITKAIERLKTLVAF